MPDNLDWSRVIAALIVFAVAVAMGLVLRLGSSRLRNRARNTRWVWDDLLSKLALDLAMPIALLAGVWFAAEIMQPSGRTLDYIGKGLTAVTVVVVALAVARLAAGAVISIAEVRQGPDASVTIFANITRVIVIGVGILIMLQTLGVSITPLLGALGVGGLAVALALQDTLANLFAGVHVLASKTIERGDYIRLATGQEGYVVDINWRNTSIRTLTDNIEVIPNQRFSDTILTNYHRPAREMSVLVQGRLPYDVDLDEVERVLTEVGESAQKTVEGGVDGNEVLVRFHTMAESAIEFSVILRTREFGEQFKFKHEFVKLMHRRFREEGIDTPFPTVRLSGDAERGGVTLGE